MTIYNVGPGQTFPTMAAISPKPGPGDIVRMHNGAGAFALDADSPNGWAGTAANPIRVVHANPAAPTGYRRTIHVTNFKHVIFEGPVFWEPKKADGSADTECFVISGALSQSVWLLGLDALGGTVGFQVNEGGGKGHLLEDFKIRDTRRIGGILGNAIGISSTAGTGWDMADRCVTIRRGLIDTVDAHGVEAQGRYGVFEKNKVFRAGRGLAGCSGFHALNTGRMNDAPGSVPLEGTFWRVTENEIAHTMTGPLLPGQDWIWLQDGNGIQWDHEAADGECFDNYCYGNDGPGIAIFDAARVKVMRNRCTDNSLDAAGYHLHRGEIAVGYDAGRAPIFLADIDVVGNVCTMTRPRLPNRWATTPPVGGPVSLTPHAWQVNFQSEQEKRRVRWRDNVMVVPSMAPPLALRWGETLVSTVTGWDGMVPRSTAPLPPPPVTEPDPDLEARIEELEAEVAALEAEVATLKTANAALTTQVATLTAQVATLTTERNTARQERDAALADVQRIRGIIKSLMAEGAKA